MNVKRSCGAAEGKAAERKKAKEDQWEEKIKRLTVISEPSSSPHLILGGGYSPFMLELLLFYETCGCTLILGGCLDKEMVQRDILCFVQIPECSCDIITWARSLALFNFLTFLTL